MKKRYIHRKDAKDAKKTKKKGSLREKPNGTKWLRKDEGGSER